MQTKRIAFRVVTTLRLSLLTGIMSTVIFAVKQYQDSPSTVITIALLATAVAAAVYLCSCVYHLIQLVELESQRAKASKQME